jgi:trehalose 6-phosphate phosphatase
VISGRDRAALAGRLPPTWLALGSYGLELPESVSRSGYPDGLDPEAAGAALEAAGGELEALARGWPATRLETKRWGRAVHFRGGAEATFDDPETHAAVGAVAARHGLEASPGRLVIEVRPKGADKGSALAALVRRLEPSAVVFAGDDLGDVPAWRELRRLSSTMPTVAAAVASPELDPSATAECDVVLEDRGQLAGFVSRLVEIARG